MQARDATGRQVSLLNDDSYSRPLSFRSASSYQTTGEISPLPHTPELLRSNSYDSNMSNYDPLSPMTPAVYDFSRSPYDDVYTSEKSATLKQRPTYLESRTSSFMDEESSNSPVPERSAKRYPCRYRDSHGCEKTFTTSGHASRHSKIHTAEKAVQCTYPGCHKKFTRADNMKQHLETHYKDKSRSSSKSSSSKSSLSASSKRGSVSARSTGSCVSSHGSQDVAMWDAEHYGVAAESSWLNLPAMSRPGAMRTSSGLDALAAIACQEGSA
ncbi:hypothetical protein BJ166DRAFT_112218 [Pestalotiopsis sp. NC0098]|nr:hypothetical protein BJ166DRAFT_112218 [Pestalotiopsis sp. NC0098]